MNKIIKHLLHGDLLLHVRKRLYIKRHLAKAYQNQEEYLIGIGKIMLKYKMDLKNPKTLNEKLNWYKLNYHTDLMDCAADKILAKEYVKSKNLEEIVVPTLATYESVDDINLDELPNKFVVKNTQDSGGVFVCRDKKNVSIEQIKNKLKAIDGQIFNGVHWALEKAYTGNNKVIVEKLLETEDGHSPWDYKFFCFHGEPKFLFVGTDRDTNVCFDFYDVEFNHLDVKQNHPNSKKTITKPANFDKMLEVCRVLSKDFPHARVDLYNINGKIYFGELTFYHFAAMYPFKPKKWDYIFGEYFDLNKIEPTVEK